MKRKWLGLAMAASMLLAGTAAGAATLVDSFEKGYQYDRDLHSQQGWQASRTGVAYEGLVTLTDREAKTGKYSVWLRPKSPDGKNIGMSRTLDFQKEVGWIDFWLKCAYGPSSRILVSVSGENFSAVAGAQPGFVYGGDTVEYNRIPADRVPVKDKQYFKPNEWTRFTLRTDSRQGRFDLYLNGRLALKDLQANKNGGPGNIKNLSIALRAYGTPEELARDQVFIDDLYLSDEMPPTNLVISADGSFAVAHASSSSAEAAVSVSVSPSGASAVSASGGGAVQPTISIDGKVVQSSSTNLVISDQPFFPVRPKEVLFRFVHISDSHARADGTSMMELNRVVNDINRMGVDFVLHSGDLADAGNIKGTEMALAELKRLKMPFYLTPGNHEKFGEVGKAGRYEEMTGFKPYYSFEYKGFLFVALDTPVAEPDHMGALDEAQLTWLEKELQKGKPTVIFTHVPLYGTYPQGSQAYEIKGPSREKLEALLAKYKPAAFLAGHLHRVNLFKETENTFFSVAPALTPLYNWAPGKGYVIWDVYPDKVAQHYQYIYYPYVKEEGRTYGESKFKK